MSRLWPWTAMRTACTFTEGLRRKAPGILKDGGRLCLEIGFDQGESVPVLLRDEGFDEIEVVRDLAGLDRVVKARKSRR